VFFVGLYLIFGRLVLRGAFINILYASLEISLHQTAPVTSQILKNSKNPNSPKKTHKNVHNENFSSPQNLFTVKQATPLVTKN
jgi:hypothetical protein